MRSLSRLYRRGSLKPEFHCLVPAPGFYEWTDTSVDKPQAFALDESRPLFAFAGIRHLWTGERKSGGGEHRLYAFLTSEAGDVVRPVHTIEARWNSWPSIPAQEALPRQRLRRIRASRSSQHMGSDEPVLAFQSPQ